MWHTPSVSVCFSKARVMCLSTRCKLHKTPIQPRYVLCTYLVQGWYVMMGRTSGPWYVQVRTVYYVRTRDVHFPTLCTSLVRPWDVVKYVLCTSHVRTFQVRTFYVLFRTKTGCKMIESTYNVRTMDI